MKATFAACVYLLIAVLLIGCNREAERKRAERLDDAITALRKIDSATQVGINNPQYTALVVDAKAKVDIASDDLPAGDLKTQLNTTLENYADAGRAWSQKFSGSDYLDATTQVGGSLIEKYSLPTVNYPYEDNYGHYVGGGHAGVIFDTALQAMWAQGRENLEKLVSSRKR